MINCKKCGVQLNAADATCFVCGTPTGNEMPVPALAGSTSAGVPYLSQRPVSGKDYLGFGILVLLSLAAGLAILVRGDNLIPMLKNILPSFCVVGAFAMPVTVSALGKDPDLSVGTLMGVSAVVLGAVTTSSGSFLLGVLTSLAVCTLLGFFNALLGTLFRVPLWMITLVTAAGYRGLGYVVGNPLGMSFEGFLRHYRVETLIGVLVLAIGIAVLFFAGLKKPKGTPTLAAGAVTGLLAAIAGFGAAVMISSTATTIGMNYGADIILPVFFAVLSSARLFKGKLSAVGMGLFAALSIYLIDLALNFYAANFIPVGMFVVTLLLLGAASAANGGLRGIFSGGEEDRRR